MRRVRRRPPRPPGSSAASARAPRQHARPSNETQRAPAPAGAPAQLLPPHASGGPPRELRESTLTFLPEGTNNSGEEEGERERGERQRSWARSGGQLFLGSLPTRALRPPKRPRALLPPRPPAAERTVAAYFCCAPVFERPHRPRACVCCATASFHQGTRFRASSPARFGQFFPPEVFVRNPPAGESPFRLKSCGPAVDFSYSGVFLSREERNYPVRTKQISR